MSDFPRGWTLTSFVGAGSNVSIVVPAITGVVHVLDAFFYEILQISGAATNEALQLTSSDGVFSGFDLAVLILSATANTSDSDSGSGLDLAAGPGASLTIAGAGAIAGVAQFLRVQGHDI